MEVVRILRLTPKEHPQPSSSLHLDLHMLTHDSTYNISYVENIVPLQPLQLQSNLVHDIYNPQHDV